MINPNEVNLIIFDTDGTIIPSLPAVYESIKRAFNKLGWPVNFNAEDINKFFGLPAESSVGGLYEFIRPKGSHLTWSEVREKVREEYRDTFREMAETFPGVRETLATLRKRGYRLVLYSNASIMYFDMVISALNIRDYFDHAECVFENNLTKPELVRKIRERFGGLTAAIVGDRFHDIEAARETGSLSVGILFGYGGEEPERADITINSFHELLSIFDRRLPVFEKILGEIDRSKSGDRPLVVGITGIDSSGKTMFTTALASYLVARGRKVQMINLDDFQNPRAVRYAGEDQADNYYHRSFNIGTITEHLLVPIHRRGEHSVTLTLLDLSTDRYDITRKFSFDRDTIVLFEGVFLFRKKLAPYIDYKIFLDISFEESKKRAAARDPEDVFNKYDTKYLPAQKIYLKEYPPAKTSDIVIDNANWEYPRIKYPA
ncbi:MAG TPA: HAD hydrolase-like protein [Dehalococcoidales bacterium]|nr:HAD hydrolase-like protein [Dehalococcoidales bacterium]